MPTIREKLNTLIERVERAERAERDSNADGTIGRVSTICSGVSKGHITVFRPDSDGEIALQRTNAAGGTSLTMFVSEDGALELVRCLREAVEGPNHEIDEDYDD